MSTTTANYGLIKPELTDPADITELNENWEKIDTKLKELSEQCENVDDVLEDEKGVAGGIASLDEDGLIPKEQLPEIYTYGTTDLTAGTSALETGKLHFVYE